MSQWRFLLTQSYMYDIVPFYIGSIAISVIYFIFSKNENISKRLFVSAHGLIFVLASSFAFQVSSMTTYEDHAIEMLIMLGLHLIGFVSMIKALTQFKGQKIIHFLLIYNLGFALMSMFVGVMSISHDWL